MFKRIHSCFHTFLQSTLKHGHSLRTAPCCLTTQHVVVTPYGRFGTPPSAILEARTDTLCHIVGINLLDPELFF